MCAYIYIYIYIHTESWEDFDAMLSVTLVVRESAGVVFFHSFPGDDFLFSKLFIIFYFIFYIVFFGDISF